MTLGLAATLTKAAIETLLVVVLILLAHALGILDRTRLPSWLPHRFLDWETPLVLGILAAMGLMRATVQVIAGCSQHAMLEWVRARIQRVQGYRMLLLPGHAAVALSEAHLMMGDHLDKASTWVFYAAQLASTCVMCASFLFGMVWLAWKETLLAVGCLMPLGALVWGLNRAILGQAAHIPRHRATLERALVRISRNRVLIRVMHLQDLEHRHFTSAVLAYFHFSCRTFFLRDAAAAMPALLGVFIIILIVGGNAAFMKTPAIVLMSFIYLFAGFCRQLATAVDLLTGMKQVQGPFDRAANLVLTMEENHLTRALEQDPSPPPLVLSPPLHQRAPSAPPAITLRGVTFRWPGARRALFENLDLSIPAGGRFAIVGPNGSGKTTLLHLILGIEDPQAGEILLDGIPAHDYAARCGPVSYVGTENLLIHGTLRSNLLYGVESRQEDAALMKVLEQVGLSEWVGTLEEGLDHPIGENEEGLSSGQKQRLSLARALLRRPSLLVLDEASASIDTQAELDLVSLLDAISPTCTMLIVSHKPGILVGTRHRLELPRPDHG